MAYYVDAVFNLLNYDNKVPFTEYSYVVLSEKSFTSLKSSLGCIVPVSQVRNVSQRS